jgi:hypothetical protein
MQIKTGDKNMHRPIIGKRYSIYNIEALLLAISRETYYMQPASQVGLICCEMSKRFYLIGDIDLFLSALSTKRYLKLANS